MTVNLLQVDSSGDERITSLFQSDEERQMYYYLTRLELSAPGCTIFTHRLSEDGHWLCTVPATFLGLVEQGYYPPRLCGCLTCVSERQLRQEFWAWNISACARRMSALEAVVKEAEDGLGR
jgi:hypothetical protein